MYNRYIAQSDGSYRRNRIPDQKTPAVQHQEKADCVNIEPHTDQHTRTQPVGGFLKQLLPEGIDTGDLIIVLLLLLMAGDNEEHRNTALLTLALYFFM